MILIKNKQKKIKVNIPKIKKDIESILNSLNYQDFDLGIWFTTNPTIKKYNKQYRKKDKATDILSFPYHTNLKAGENIKDLNPTDSNPEDKNLGDIIISLEFCKKAASEFNKPFSVHLQRLIVHGIAHLLGYTHESDKEFEKMSKFENKLLNLLSS